MDVSNTQMRAQTSFLFQRLTTPYTVEIEIRIRTAPGFSQDAYRARLSLLGHLQHNHLTLFEGNDVQHL